MNGPPKRSSVTKADRIPDELERFVRRDTYALLIKGKAGTGKTTLSLTILRTLGQASNFFYISTRVSPRQLFTYYPWLEQFVQTIKPQPSSENEEQVYRMSMFEDARLDEPESLFERITNELMDVRAPTIIIDSWDAIASFMDKEARLNNERVLQTWRERAGAKLIFISEDLSYSTLDFLVDGIVELEQTIFNSSRLRQIKMIKLRGTKILNQVQYFSLNNSTFTSFQNYNPSEYDLNRFVSQDDLPKRKEFPLEPYSISGIGRIRTGYRDLDIVLKGGLPKKGIVILRYDPTIHIITIITFLAKIISNFIKRNNPVLFELFSQTDPRTIMTILSSYLGYFPNNDIFRVLWSDIKDSDHEQQIESHQISHLKNSTFGNLKNSIEMVRKKYPESLMLYISNWQHLKSLDDELSQSQTCLISFLKEKTDLSIFVRATGEAVCPRVESNAYLKLELNLINGSLFLRPVSPVGPYFGMDPYKLYGIPRVNLRALV